MPKHINGGQIDDEAAAILAKLSKDMSRGQVITLALKKYMADKNGSLNIEIVQHAGFLNGSFNWFQNLKFVVAIRNFIAVYLPEFPDILPKFIWIFGGAAGAAYVLIAFFGLWPN